MCGFGSLQALVARRQTRHHLGDRETQLCQHPFGGRQIGSGLLALGMVAAAASPDVWVAAAFVAVVGLGNGAAVVCNALLVQRGVPDELRGRAFTVAMSLNYAVLGLGLIAAGPITDALGPRAVWAIGGGLAAVAAVIGLTMARGAAARSEPALQVSP